MLADSPRRTAHSRAFDNTNEDHMATTKGIVTKVKEAVTEFFSPEEVSKSPARVAAGRRLR